MDSALENTIVDALEALDRGENVEQILDRFPQHAPALRPILETAAGLADLSPLPSTEARSLSRQQFLAEARRLREESFRETSHHDGSTSLLRRFYYSLASFAVLLVLLGVILVPPSAGAIPGDILYPVKRGVETLRLYLAPQEEKEALRGQYEEERNHEVYEMIEVGRDGSAGYVGMLKAIQPHQWEIGNITALINDSTVIRGEPEVGARVEAHCLVKDRQVIAESLTIIDPPMTLTPANP